MAKVRPQMFRDESPSQKKAKTQKLSSLANLGSVMEKVMNKAGIATVDQFKEMGWQEALKKLMKIHARYRHTIYAEVLIGALKDLPWHKIPEADKKAAKNFVAAVGGKKPRTSKKPARKT